MNTSCIMPARVFFFWLWPLFARAPCHWLLEYFFAVVPGCAKCFVLLRPVGRRDISAGPEQKKTPPRVIFVLLRPRGRKSPVGRRHGARAKKNTTQGVFLLLRPRRKAGEGEAPLDAATFRRGQSQNKHTTQCAFFGPAPLGGRGRRRARVLFCCCAFVSCLVLLVSRILLAVVPGRAELFSLLRPIRRCKLFGGAGAKNNTTQSISIVAAAFVGLHHLSAPSQPVCHWSRALFCCPFRASRSVLFVAAGWAPILSSRPGRKTTERQQFFREPMVFLFDCSGPRLFETRRNTQAKVSLFLLWLAASRGFEFCCFPLDSTTFRRGPSKGKRSGISLFFLFWCFFFWLGWVC